MSDLVRRQIDVDRAIFGAVLGCLPPEWTRARLRARVARTGPEGIELELSIDAMGQEGIAIVSDELQDAVRALFLLHEQHSTNLAGLAYSYERRADGRWAFSADLDYAD